MSLFAVGQRFVSEPEPELGLGIVVSVDRFRVGLSFPSSGEQRLYASDTAALKRSVFRVGERVSPKGGNAFVIESVEEADGLNVYSGGGESAREDELEEAANSGAPQERLMSGQADTCEAFELRYETLMFQNKLRRSELRGFIGGRVDLIPHQLYILKEVSSRQIPRVLLSDEVGLGKTIEACLILQRLLTVGRVKRALILVPESLVHQWFVELLRRFNLWFSIFDEERCRASAQTDPEGNPFLDQQLALCSVSFLANSEVRREQAIAAGWDMVIVDEAHHLEWSPAAASPEYELVEKLGSKSLGLLLLTATPTQLGLDGHFARLRLLDKDRFSSLEVFREEVKEFGVVAQVAGKIVEGTKLTKSDIADLKRIFDRDEEGLEKRLEALEAGKKGARESLIKALLDEHGTGRVVFRNSRANMKGFPKRMYCPAPLEAGEAAKTTLDRLARELEADVSGDESSVRYSFKGDPRIEWLASLLKARKGAKVLLICRTKRKAKVIEEALLEVINVNVALFHEDLPLVQRDRNAAWFAEPEGAQILISSEIGSEGRNFQFAHHLVLFDLPHNPGLLEQRIGRLDRIGQTETIQVHVPYLVGSAQEFIVEWYHQGLDAFEACVHGGMEYVATFGERLLKEALAYGRKAGKSRDALESFIEETQAFRAELAERLKKGRDRLLELNSFDATVANKVVAQLQEAERDGSLRTFLFKLLEFYGVRIDEHEGGEVVFNANHAFVEGFPSIPKDGMLATFLRQKAISREDIAYISPDHPLVSDSFDLMVNSDRGGCAFGIVESSEQNVLVEAIFRLEGVALSKLHLDRFLSPTPIRVLVDIRGRDLTKERDFAWTSSKVSGGSISRFLDRPGVSVEILNALIGGAEEIAEAEVKTIKAQAKTAMKVALAEEAQRLVDLKKLNDAVRQEEIDMARSEIRGLQRAIDDARLRLDSVRLIATGSVEGLKLQPGTVG